MEDAERLRALIENLTDGHNRYARTVNRRLARLENECKLPANEDTPAPETEKGE